MRLPRFMEEQQMTGAQIGTAFHRMMRMLDFDALRATHQLEAEIARQRERLLADGIVSENELAAVKPYLLVRLFASPLGVRMLAGTRAAPRMGVYLPPRDGDGRAALAGRD